MMGPSFHGKDTGMKFRLILFFFFSTALVGKVTIINLPSESNVVHDVFKTSVSHYLVSDLENLFNGHSDRIHYLTSAEAHKYLTDYVKQKYGDERAKELIDRFFNNRYFGEEKELEKTPEEIAAQDPYMFTHILNMMTLGVPGHERTMENAKKRWSLETLFLTPEEVFNALKKNKSRGWRIPADIHNFEEYKKQFPDKAAIFSESFNIPQDPAQRKEYFLQHPLGFLTQSLIADIYEAAQKIMAATRQGDYIVIFGNTPYFVGRALQKMISLDSHNHNYRKIIEFPFSGAPNAIREFPKLKDLVTQERLDYLKKRLEVSGLSPHNKDLEKHSVYFVDVIATGSGLAYLIEELLRMFKQAHMNIPDFNIISLNKIDITNKEDPRNARIADRNANDGEHLTFYFPTKQEPHFSIDAQVIYLPGHGLLDMLPSEAWRIFPEYNAAYWQPEYDYLLNYRKKKLPKMLLEFFDTNLEHLMKK